QKELQAKLDALVILKLQLNLEKGSLEIEKESLKKYGDNILAQKNILTNQQNEKERILSITKGEQKKYEKLLADTEEKTRAIQKEIFELEDKLRFTIDQSKIPSPRSGILAKPTMDQISQKYGPTNETGFINDFYNFHNGIDIKSGLGTPIKAARNGMIKATGDNGQYAYGKWIAIEHDNGLTTLYAHLSLVSVGIGDKVEQGEIIGYTGKTGWSTGPHLHFGVYATHTFQIINKWFGPLPMGGHLNPLDYL
ncbi:MAG: peptidoglycan DD-metalloendopeptidase family protein, partial [Patescibacteria group bacterium]